jgi:anti-sigma regulatory factor (Ser/Thr protein kinase)
MKDFATKNNLAELENLTLAIATYYRDNGVPEEICYDVRLALEEAISNTIKYGYDDQQTHTIHVRAGFDNLNLIIQIEDDAKAFNPLEAPAPDLSLPVEKKPIGCLGIYLMRSVIDQIDYKRNGTRNILRMKKIRVTNT